MQNLTFDTLNMQWNQLRRARPDLGQVVMQRIGDTPDSLTVMFRGFDTMTDQSPQLVKRMILQWIKQMGSVQIAPGDASSFILRIAKPVSTPQVQVAPQPSAPNISESLVQISKVRKVHGN